MRRLVLKMFLAYWIAAGTVVAISDFEPHPYIHNPELLDALNGSLRANARVLTDAYERGRCAEAESALSSSSDSLSLASEDGSLLCGATSLPGSPDLRRLAAQAERSGRRTTENYALYQVIALPVKSQGGRRYVLLFRNSYSSALHTFGLLPGYTTIVISFVVTLFLALLIALPIRRLREAARSIAAGELGARVRWGRWVPGLLRLEGDDIGKLIASFNHMADRLETLFNAQRLLLRDVSHELRSPLARLSVALGLARHHANADMQPHLERIQEETTRLNDMIGQILSFSYMESIHELQDRAPVRLGELLLDLLPDIEYESEAGGCEVSAQVASECVVRGDAGLLRAAVENVLRNAIRHAAHPGRVEAKVAPSDDAPGMALLSVGDNGSGVPEQELEQVVKPFYRAESSRGSRSGFGVGLAIADRAVRLHGGSISISNRPTGGLLVRIELPLSAV